MKLNKLPFTKRRLLAMMVGMVAYGGVAQAQFTGIGLTDPDATLHVRPITAGTDEPLQVESIIDYAGAPAYTDVLLHDPTTGLFRRESVADLLEDNGQWVIVAGELVPRNTPFSGHIAFTATTMEVNVPTDITGTLDVSGASTLASTLSVGDVTVATTIDDADEVLFQGAGLDLVQSISVANLLASSSYWDFTAGTNTLQPSDADIADDFILTDDVLTIDAATTITGATAVNGTFTVDASASTLGGTLGVTGATTLSDDLSVTGNTDMTGTLSVTDVTVATTIADDDEVLFQGAGVDLVQSISVANLLASSSYWDFTAGTNTLLPSDADIADDFVLTDELLTIGAVTNITGATTITGATAVNGTFTVDASASTLGGTLGVTGATTLSDDLSVTGNTDMTGTLSVTDVTVATTIADDDEVLFQGAGADLVQSISVANLLASSSYWDFTAGTNTLLPSDADIADDFVLTDELLTIGAVTNITGATTITGATAVNGTFTVDASASTLGGTLDVTGNTNLDGTLSIGTVAEISGSPLAATDEILLQRAGTNLVEYVTVEDLVSSNSEWVYEDNGTSGTVDAADRIYVRRLDATVATDDAVYVDGIGNMVVDATKAYQFGAATSQINAVGITAAADYTVDINGGSLTFATDADEDVSFTENSEPWLYYQASADYGPANAFGNAGSERGRVGINTDAPEATLHVAGNIVASNVTVTSDRRFKKDIKDISGALDLVKALRGVSYDFRADEFPKENFDSKNHIGFIAQEIREVLPQTVMERGDGFLTVDYAAVTPVLVEAVQELSKQVEALQAENATLRSASEKSVGAVSTKQLRELEARLADMDARLQEVAGRK